MRTLLFFSVLLFSISIFSQNKAEIWADSIIKTLSLKEKIGQLIMMEVYSNKNDKYKLEVIDSIKKYQPGTIVFFQGSPNKEIVLTNTWQKYAKIPMLIAMDAEWGPAMRLDSIIPFPRLMALSATNDTLLIFRYGQAIGEQCKRLGIHINFAPVVDVNNNSSNPVINYRSFGENQHKVAKYASVFCNGMQSKGVLAVAKHFPGHGNTSQDSHKTLPDISDNAEIIDSVHLYPFKTMINSHIWGIMVAHVFAPALDTTSSTPASINKNIINELLRKKLNYKGLIVTDALGMQGVLKHNKPGSIEIKAILAGNDALLMPKNISIAFDSVLSAVQKGQITEDIIDISVKKILLAKYNEGLKTWAPINEINITNDLNKIEYLNLKKEIYKNASTLIYSKDISFPLIGIKNKIALLSFKTQAETHFQREMMKYFDVDAFYIHDDLSEDSIKKIIKQTINYNLTIVAINNMAFWTKNNYGLTPEIEKYISDIGNKTKVILCLFGNPYAFKIFNNYTPNALITTYERDTLAEIECAQSICGLQEFKGKLPISISEKIKEGSGICTKKINSRLIEIAPELVNADTNILKQIDSIVFKAIEDEAFPGCQILAAKDGKVFYNKTFGYHDYKKTLPVKKTDLYDLASITKIFSTTLAVMKLWEEKKFKLDDKLSEHLPTAKHTNVGKLHIDRILTHSAGLKAWVPFYKETLINGNLNPKYYNKKQDDKYSICVCDSIFLRNDYIDTIIQKIYNLPVSKSINYVYSDLGMILMKEMIEYLSNMLLDKYVDDNFYQPLGLSLMTFNPLSKFKVSCIIPSEDDTYFRKKKVHGCVHDQAAAMFGGVSGHAGLFGNAWDAATIMQMLLDSGKYAETQYLLPSTVQLFTSTYFDRNRRGLGFDKPDGLPNGNACIEASSRSFGHSGFTGTYVWADPKNNLVYIFLSNRTYPSSENRKIITQNIRTRIHTIFYESLKK